MENIKEIMICNKCRSEVREEKELDYPYYCKNCDENMYSFEVTPRLLEEDNQ